MTDGIEIFKLPTTPEHLHSIGLDFNSKVSRKTGDISDKEVALADNLVIVIYPSGSIKLTGSITSFYKGDNTHNLTYNEVVSAIDMLCTKFDINAEGTVLNGFEVGLNINTEFNPDYFLNELIAWHGIKPHCYKGSKEYYVQFSASQRTLKIYSKSKQYGLFENMIRCELRIDKMEFAERFGVRTLADLKDLSKLKALINELLCSFDNLIYYDDTIELSKLKKTDKNQLQKGNNERYWSNKKLHRNTYKDNRLRFQSLVRKHGKMNYHKLRQQIEETGSSLLKKHVQSDRHKKEPKNQNSVHSDTLNNMSYCTCIVTGINKPSKGKFITESDIKYFIENDKSTFEYLINEFNTTSYKNIDYSLLPIEKRIEEIAHRIRSVDYNKRNNTKRAINNLMNNKTPTLFDNWQLISEEKKRIAGLI